MPLDADIKDGFFEADLKGKRVSTEGIIILGAPIGSDSFVRGALGKVGDSIRADAKRLKPAR